MPRTVTGWLGLGFIGVIVFWLGANLVNDPSEFFNVAFIGLTNGAVYALIALGYTLVYGILQLINFAHGDVFALSGLVASTVIVGWIGLGAGVEHRRGRARDRRSRSSSPSSSPRR